MAAIKTRPVDHLELTVSLDPWFSLKGAADYTSLSVRTLRTWLIHLEHPLPHYRVGGKVLVRRGELDRWLETFRRVCALDLDGTVDQILREFRESNRESGGQARKARLPQGSQG